MKQPLELHSGPNPDPFQGDLCIPDAHGRCVTCSDDAQPVRVLSLDQESWTAQVEMEGRSRDVDVDLENQPPRRTLRVLTARRR